MLSRLHFSAISKYYSQYLPVPYFVRCIIAVIKQVPSVQHFILCILAAVLAVPSDPHLVLQIGSCSICSVRC